MGNDGPRDTTVVSISLNRDMIKELDALQRSLGFTGRSEIVRAGIRTFVQEEKQKQEMSGNKSAVLTVVHNDEFDDQVAGIKQDYEGLIKTHLHNKIDKDRCVEVLMLEGDAEMIKMVTSGFLTNKKMDSVKLVIL